MRIRLKDIALRTGDGDFPIGAELVVGEDIDAGLAQLRLEAKTAELVGEDGDVLSADVAAAIEAHQAAFGLMQTSLGALVVAVEAGGLADARAFVELMNMRSPEDFAPILDLARAIEWRVKDADDTALAAQTHQVSSTEGSPAQVVDEAASSTAASEDATDDGSAASEVLSAVEPTDDETTAAPLAVVETEASDAATDTPPTTDQAATAEPAAVAEAVEDNPPKAKAKAKAKAGGNPATGS